LGIILATQDVASLQDETTKKLVLANTRTKLLMATDFPEEPKLKVFSEKCQ